MWLSAVMNRSGSLLPSVQPDRDCRKYPFTASRPRYVPPPGNSAGYVHSICGSRGATAESKSPRLKAAYAVRNLEMTLSIFFDGSIHIFLTSCDCAKTLILSRTIVNKIARSGESAGCHFNCIVAARSPAVPSSRSRRRSIEKRYCSYRQSNCS